MARESRETDNIVELAHRLRQISPGKWTDADLRRTAADQDWEWVDDERGPLLRTETPFGDAWLSPVDTYTEDYVTTEEYVGLHFLVTKAGGRTRDGVEAFREAHELLRDALGPSFLLGADDTNTSFHGDAPHWGAPYVRWRTSEHPDLIELRATTRGIVLTLRPKDPSEGWYTRTVEHSDGRVGGFVVHALAHQNVGLQLPGITLHPEWRGYGTHLSSTLRTRAAEMTALGLTQPQGLYTAIPGKGAGLAFSLTFGEHTELGITTILAEDADLETMDLPSMGWIEATEEHHLRNDIIHLAPSHRYDEVNGVRMALMLLEVAERAGLESPHGLSIADDIMWLPWLDRTYGPCRVNDYGFALRTVEG